MRAIKFLPLARVTATGEILPAGLSYQWTVTELTTGQSQTRSGGPELLVAPGRYRVAVRVPGWEEFALGFDEARLLRLQRKPGAPPLTSPSPTSGVLAVRTQVQSSALPADPAAVEIQLRGPAGQRANGPDAILTGLPPGTYAASARAAELEVLAPHVRVDPGQTTGLTLLFAPARLKLEVGEPAERVVWRLTRWRTGERIERRGRGIDLILPSGDYRVQVWADEGSATLEHLEVRDFVQQWLTLTAQ